MTFPTPNQFASLDGAMTPLSHIGHQWRGAIEFYRWAASHMRKTLYCLVWIAVGLCAGCATKTPIPTRTCEVHHTMMKLVAVHGTGVCVLPPGRYSEARPTLFPNTYPLYLPKGRIHLWICEACREAERQWYDTHRPNQAIGHGAMAPLFQIVRLGRAVSEPRRSSEHFWHLDSICPTHPATIATMNKTQQFVQAVQILAPDDQFILQAAQRIPEEKLPAFPGGAALEFVVAIQKLRSLGRCNSFSPAAHKRKACRNQVKSTTAQLSVSHALTVKSAEYWLKLGEPAQALMELEKLPGNARKHPLAVKALVSATGALREMDQHTIQA